MRFKNINTAIDQELGRIRGVQNHTQGAEYTITTHEKSIFDKPLEFDPWLLKGMNYHYEKYGTEFQTVGPGLMRIIPKNGEPFLRTWEDFHREWEIYYENYYL